MPSIKIYSTPSCTYCNMAKDYFKANGVSYEEFNVAVDVEKRSEMVEKSGQMGVPVIVIGEEVVVGFNEPKLKELLGL